MDANKNMRRASRASRPALALALSVLVLASPFSLVANAASTACPATGTVTTEEPAPGAVHMTTAAGQNVVFHAQWDVSGWCGFVYDVATLDGAACGWCGDVSANLPLVDYTWNHAPISAGPHTITMEVDTANQFQTVAKLIATWSFTVVECGSAALQPTTETPTGTAGGTEPAIGVTFRDGDTPCGAGSATMTLDGASVTPVVTSNGADYTATYTPTAPLADGTHTVSATMAEACCDVGASPGSTGSASWSFVVSSCGNNPLQAQTTTETPTGSTADPQPRISVVFHDLDRLCGIQSASVIVNGVTAPQSQVSVTIEGNDALVSFTPSVPLLPGPNAVSISVTETCCNTAGGTNTGQASWTFVDTVDPTGPTTIQAGTFGLDGGNGVPGQVTIPVVCVPFVCTFPKTVDTPAQALVTYHVGSTQASLTMDPLVTKQVPEIDLVVAAVCPPTSQPPCPDVPQPQYDIETLPFTLEFGVQVASVNEDTGPHTIPAIQLND